MIIATVALLLAPPQLNEFCHRDSNWIKSLPLEVQREILWHADHEEGDLYDWEFDGDPDNNGGGVFASGEPNEARASIDHSNPFEGKYSVKASIANALDSQNGNKAIRLMRWTHRPWDQDGEFFPNSAYYGVWMRIDRQYDTRNEASESGGWWNVFQFKSDDERGESQPVWVLNVGNHHQTGKMQFYLYSKVNRQKSVSQLTPVPIPVGRWFHVEAYYQQSSGDADDGRITVWQDGQQILSAEKVRTVLTDELVWGIGNYTDHITGDDQPGSATICFDDAVVSTKATHPFVADYLEQKKK